MTGRRRRWGSSTGWLGLPCIAAAFLVTACTSGQTTSTASVATQSAAPTSASAVPAGGTGSGSSLDASAVSASSGGSSAAASVTGSAPASSESNMPTDGAGTAGGEQFTPAVMRVMSTPRWFSGTDGRVHLVYELQLTNGFPVPITVTEVAVADAGSGTVLGTLTGADVAASMSAQAAPTKPTATVPASSVAIVWMDVTVADPADLPTRIAHTLTITVPPGLPVPATITSTGASAYVSPQPPTVIGPPLTGDGWIALPSCCDGPHRRSVQPINNAFWLSQRFAIDFNKINNDRLLVVGDPNQNSAWITYDKPVLAVAEAKVVAAADKWDDQVPNAPTPVDIEEADGNYVILELATGVYAFYAHLEPGTVAVEAGETVSKGQVIGRTGNSGSSTGSHLHFQLMDRPSALVADGLPFEFDAFTLEGQSPPLAELMALDPAADPVQVDPADAGARTDQLPMSRDVITFGGS